jgi:hypothetical protein
MKKKPPKRCTTQTMKTDEIRAAVERGGDKLSDAPPRNDDAPPDDDGSKGSGAPS